MSVLKRSFKLLDGFELLGYNAQKERITQVDKLLMSIEKRCRAALLVIRDGDQLRKQHAYMLIQSGNFARGIKAIESIVAGYEKAIEDLHEEASFQLAEAALAAFQKGQHKLGSTFARRALAHAGSARRLCKTLTKALDLAQQWQMQQNRLKSRNS